MNLVTTKEFNGVTFDCYMERANDLESTDFWVTCEQIGQLLEYDEPRDAIAKIHRRNQKRLDKFSYVAIRINQRLMR